jgi:hypothetical protein
LQNGHEIILMIDTNEEIGHKPGGINAVVSKSGLHDIIARQHPADKYPNTYARGSSRIDYIFGTEGILQHCKSSGILPFGSGYPSDHRAVFIKVDLSGVLSTQVQTVESMTSRLISSATPRERETFLQTVHKHYKAQNLYQRLAKLNAISTDQWNEYHQEEYNKCDEQHILGMLAAEKKTCKVKTTAWSPTYSKVVESKAIILRTRHFIHPGAPVSSVWSKAIFCSFHVGTGTAVTETEFQH